ncbi:MAG: RNA polymerase [Micrococcales bacterium 70-64]|nr:sigma-70 family RNA polymerase sigma factor [Leifsonia sp.]ODU65703.1 MAG: RNA polymerase [Leifsonia sp. SCN 70-46]OJX84330.1 MAG: RNA polymerase [Micrococcales bacterium 70-64]
MGAFDAEITRLAREEGGHVLALLAHRFGDLDLADECVQDALLAATSWESVPANPAAWLFTVARNRAVDRLRRAAAERRRLSAASYLMTLPETEEPDMVVEHSDVGDERLRLVLLCCHPALDRDAQVALTLRLVGGLTTPEIASAFLVPEATLAQRIVRAKRKIRDAGIPLSIPASLDERVETVLTVLYLVYNEGYLSRSAEGARLDLVDEAIRLTTALASQLPDNPEVLALLALELYGKSRSKARFAGGELVLLEDQDRTTWDAQLIGHGNRALAAALARDIPGPFQLQAWIASQHANARTAADTDWTAIASAYAQLLELAPSPVVALNRAVAVAMADGAPAGLALLDDVHGLDEYHLYWAARGELLARSGDEDAAAPAFRRARALTTNAAELRHLDRRIAALLHSP